MNGKIPHILAFSIFFLFFIQACGTLIESIYILDLLHTSLDAKALGVLFFFTPALLLLFRRQVPPWLVWPLFGFLALGRVALPYLPTSGRLFASGIATGAALSLLPFLALSCSKGETHSQGGFPASIGLALAIGLSVLLRTLDFSLDYSLTISGGWTGVVLALLFGWALTRFDWKQESLLGSSTRRLTPAVLGIFLILTLVYFAFSAPAVIARWTEGSYVLIVGAVSLFSLGWAVLAIRKPRFIERLPQTALVLWNAFFTLSLVGTLLAQRIHFPPTPTSPAVVVGQPTWLQQAPMLLMLLLFPVLFLDLRVFFQHILQAQPGPRAFVPGILLGSLALVLLIFISIFTNVWGYVAPVSTPFRNQFWLPFLLAAGGLIPLVSSIRPLENWSGLGLAGKPFIGWTVILGVLFLATGASALLTDRPVPGSPGKNSILVMTYNLQAGNDATGERSYDRQLDLIRQISPDLVALQESDTARISLNNDDYVRYFASRLGYYSYYGPRTVTGTFGTAMLSRYPLRDTHSVFTFSDTDEIGTAEAEIEVGGRTFSIYDVHPDGSDTAMLAFARSLVARSAGEANVIALGDFNLRDTEEAYRVVAGAYDEAWTTVYPAKIGADGVDMSDRIDHIFVSPGLRVLDPVYLLPPASASDHPVHWAQVSWEK